MKTLITLTFFSFLFISCGKEVVPDRTEACDGSSTENCECFKATNRERVNKDLPAFNYCMSCFKMAQEHADDMAKYNYFSHDRAAVSGRPAETFAARAGRFGLGWGAGENIASGSSGSGAVAQWMASSGHKANILNPSFKSFACGYNGGLSVQVFSAGQQ